MAYQRDPVSVLYDGGARRLLERAYAANGGWAGTRLARPGPRHVAWAARRGIDPFGPDNASAVDGRNLNARSRWARGFVRAVYYQHRWYSDAPGGGWRGGRRVTARHSGALEVQVGPGTAAGWPVRIRLRKGGGQAAAAVRRMPVSARIYDDAGRPAARWSDPEARDW